MAASQNPSKKKSTAPHKSTSSKKPPSPGRQVDASVNDGKDTNTNATKPSESSSDLKVSSTQSLSSMSSTVGGSIRSSITETPSTSQAPSKLPPLRPDQETLTSTTSSSRNHSEQNLGVPNKVAEKLNERHGNGAVVLYQPRQSRKSCVDNWDCFGHFISCDGILQLFAMTFILAMILMVVFIQTCHDLPDDKTDSGPVVIPDKSSNNNQTDQSRRTVRSSGSMSYLIQHRSALRISQQLQNVDSITNNTTSGTITKKRMKILPRQHHCPAADATFITYIIIFSILCSLFVSYATRCVFATLHEIPWLKIEIIAYLMMFSAVLTCSILLHRCYVGTWWKIAAYLGYLTSFLLFIELIIKLAMFRLGRDPQSPYEDPREDFNTNSKRRETPVYSRFKKDFNYKVEEAKVAFKV